MAYPPPAYRGSPATAAAPRRKPSPQSLIGATALAFVTMACGWTVYANVAGPAVQPLAIELPAPAYVPGVSAALRTAVAQPVATPTPVTAEPPATFTERFLARAEDVAAAKPTLAKGDRLPIARQQAALPAEPQVPVKLELAAATPADEAPAVTGALPAAAREAAPVEARQQAALAIPLPVPRPAAARALPADGPSQREAAQANKAAALAAIAAPKPSIFERLFGKSPVLAYAAPDGGIASDGRSLSDGAISMRPPFDRQTAVYDISARTVYMPDGSKLEAHSGLGAKMDDPRFAHVRMHGVTPPHVYEIAPRESLFHGVEALRLHPVGGSDKIFGRTGLLAHSYMLGPRGDSNGCVSFKDYEAFLRAYKNNEVKRLVVLARLD
jgi:hypothetical protein